MKYTRFEELPVWKEAVALFRDLDALLTTRRGECPGDLYSQIMRATLSISNNIAEGFELGTTQQLITFVYTARGSAGEVRSMLNLLDTLERFADLKSEISNLRSRTESISRQLRGWADSLQNTDIKGQRYLTEASRSASEQKSRSDAFLKHLEAINRESRIRRGEEP
jgi:four helix bundle protein